MCENVQDANLCFSGDGVRSFWTVGKMEADESNDRDHFSDDDVGEDLSKII